MGRIPLESYRVNCRISKQAGKTLEELLRRMVWPGRKRPVGSVLSRLIMQTQPETWREILSHFETKPWKARDRKRVRVIREIKGEKYQRQKGRRPIAEDKEWTAGSQLAHGISISGTIKSDRGKMTPGY